MTPTRFQLIRAALLTWKDGVVERLSTKTTTVEVTETPTPPARESLSGVSVKALRRKYRNAKKEVEDMILANNLVTRQRDLYRTAFVTAFALFLSVSGIFAYDHMQNVTASNTLSERVAHLEHTIATKNVDMDKLLAERNQIAAQYTSVINETAGLRQQIASLSEEVSATKTVIAERDKKLAELSLERVKDVPVQTIEIKKGQPVAVASYEDEPWYSTRPVTNTVIKLWNDWTK